MKHWRTLSWGNAWLFGGVCGGLSLLCFSVGNSGWWVIIDEYLPLKLSDWPPHCLFSTCAGLLPHGWLTCPMADSVSQAQHQRPTVLGKVRLRKERQGASSQCHSFSSHYIFRSFNLRPFFTFLHHLPLSWPSPCQTLRQRGPLLTGNWRSAPLNPVNFRMLWNHPFLASYLHFFLLFTPHPSLTCTPAWLSFPHNPKYWDICFQWDELSKKNGTRQVKRARETLFKTIIWC